MFFRFFVFFLLKKFLPQHHHHTQQHHHYRCRQLVVFGSHFNSILNLNSIRVAKHPVTAASAAVVVVKVCTTILRIQVQAQQ